MNLDEAARAAWEALTVDGDSPVPSDVDTDGEATAEAPADSTPEAGTSGTSEPVAEADTETVDDDDVDVVEDSEPEEVELEGDPVVIGDDDVVTYQGKTAKAKDLFEMRADYTRKTQELASQREELGKQAEEVSRVYSEMTEWYQSKSSDPVGWLAEIASDTGNATRAVALLITKLNEEGALDPEFVEVFDLKAPDSRVTRTARESEVDARIAKLEADRAAAEERAASTQAEAEAAKELNRQVADLIKGEGLSFDSDRDLTLFRIELFETATAAGITDLGVAYELMSSRKAKADAAQTRKEQALARKRAAKVSRPETAAPTADADTRFASVEDAARAAMTTLFVSAPR